jgi:competence protein ComEC
MLTAAMGAQALGRRPDSLRALGCSLLVPAVLDPLIATDVSFVLSAAATSGLIVLNRPIAAVIVRGPSIFHKPMKAIATTLAAMIGCTPWIATLSPTLPVLGILANLFAAPIGEVAALPICLAHAVLWWAPSVERGAALLGSGALIGVRAIARITTAAGGALSISPPSSLQLAAVAVAATAMAIATSRIRRAMACSGGIAAFLLFELLATRAGSPHGLLRIHALDVGQGDAYLIDLPEGGAMLVDGGGFMGSPVDTGLRVVLPVLRAKRRTRIDVVVLSHPHPDHFGGLASTLPQVDVGEFWDTGQGEDQGAGPTYAALVRGLKARTIPVRRPDALCGEHVVGGARIEVLAPCPAYQPDWGANDNSFVIRISYGSRSALLVGDAEHEEEAALVARRPDALRADLLKIGHHGSRTSSTPPFLDAVSPALAIISCGVRNRYGHPSPSVLDALTGRGIQLARTDRGGEVIWETDGESIKVTRPVAR